MAIPSGTGTEVLTRGVFTETDTTEIKILDGVNLHIYTVLSIVITETVGAAEVFSIWLDANAAGTDYELVSYQALAGNKTFIFNDRVVLMNTDELLFKSFGTCNIDIVISYIDQDWT